MTQTNYKERHPDEKSQTCPDWYRRFFNRVVGYNVADSLILPIHASSPDESRVDLSN